MLLFYSVRKKGKYNYVDIKKIGRRYREVKRWENYAGGVEGEGAGMDFFLGKWYE